MAGALGKSVVMHKMHRCLNAAATYRRWDYQVAGIVVHGMCGQNIGSDHCCIEKRITGSPAAGIDYRPSDASDVYLAYPKYPKD